MNLVNFPLISRINSEELVCFIVTSSSSATAGHIQHDREWKIQFSSSQTYDNSYDFRSHFVSIAYSTHPSLANMDLLIDSLNGVFRNNTTHTPGERTNDIELTAQKKRRAPSKQTIKRRWVAIGK